MVGDQRRQVCPPVTLAGDDYVDVGIGLQEIDCGGNQRFMTFLAESRPAVPTTNASAGI